MKTNAKIIAVLAGALFLTACSDRQTFDGELSGHLPGFFDCIREEDGFLISAHRGGVAPGYPENAIETLLHTLESGPAMLEVDVRQTADGALVLMHDETVDRTTTGTGSLSAMTLASLEAVTLIANDSKVTPYKVPRLEDALAAVKGRGILTLDIKDVDFSTLIAALEKAEALDDVVLISYSMADAWTLRDLAPQTVISVSIRHDDDLKKALDRLGDPRLLVAWTGTWTPDHILNYRIGSEEIEINFGAFRSADLRTGRAGTSAYRALHQQGVDILATDAYRKALDAVDQTATRACWNRLSE